MSGQTVERWRLDGLLAELAGALAERDRLAEQLAAVPVVPEGHEVVVLPEWVSDEVAGWAGCNALEAALADAGSAAIARRPKPEPQVERVPWGDAHGRRHVSGSTIVEVGCDLNGPWIRVTEGGMKLYSQIEHGTVDVLAEDGPS